MPANPSIPYGPIKSRVVRVVRLDACGKPVSTGTRNQIVTNGFIKADFKPNVVKGTEYSVKNANGDLAINDIDPDIIKSFTLTLELAVVDPDLLDIIGGQSVIAQAQVTGGPGAVGQTIGFKISSAPLSAMFAIEVWTKLSGLACASSSPVWLYTVVPWLTNGTIGDLSFGNNAVTFTLTADSKISAGDWGTSPFTITKPTPDLTIAAGDMFGQILTTVQPPVVTNGAAAIT